MATSTGTALIRLCCIWRKVRTPSWHKLSGMWLSWLWSNYKGGKGEGREGGRGKGGEGLSWLWSNYMSTPHPLTLVAPLSPPPPFLPTHTPEYPFRMAACLGAAVGC